MQFTKATKKAARLRLALIGPAGSGKTFTGLTLAKHLGGKVAVIDTERGSASKYADLFDFDVLELDSYSPQTYVAAIHAAEEAGYDVLVIDSLSHAWVGKGGALEMHDVAVDRQRGTKNTYTAWRDVTPHHMALVDAMLQSRCHVIGSVRSKTEYVQEKGENGKTTVRKVGLAPVQRDGLEYEFDVVGDLDTENTLVISKTRCPALNGAALRKPGKELADVLKAWLTGAETPTLPANGEPVRQQPATSPPKPSSTPGVRLRDYLGKRDEFMARDGLAQKGELLSHVIAAGVAKGYSDDVTAWQDNGECGFGMEEAKRYEATRRQQVRNGTHEKDEPSERDQDGVKLENWLRAQGRALHAEGCCDNESSLLDYIRAEGMENGLPRDLPDWKGLDIKTAVELARKWLAKARQAVPV